MKMLKKEISIMKTVVFTCTVTAILLLAEPIYAADKENEKLEQTTELPLANMTLLDSKVENMKIDSAGSEEMIVNKEKENTEKIPTNSQQHTITDFIIHPLIALKPRLPEAVNVGESKQAAPNSNTSSPWQLFGFSPGQSLGSSVSSFAGWLGNRIQLPGFLDTSVNESSTTTTTTARPDIVVRIKQRPPTKKPLISIKNGNEHPHRRTKKPNRFNSNQLEDYEEESDDDFYDDEDEDDNFNNKRKRYQNDEEDDDEDGDDSGERNDEYEEDYEDDENSENDDEEEDDENEEPIKINNKRRRHSKPMKFANNSQRKQKKPQESTEIEEYEDDDDQDFYYNENRDTRRSQNEQNIIQRGRQTLLNQIKQFTRGHTPAEIENILNESQKSPRRKYATLIINRNGQTIYMAPELLQISESSNNKLKPLTQLDSATSEQVKHPSSEFPQPPLTTPYKKKNKPTQYITIPWSQLGISPPDQLATPTKGVQTEPLILNIPQKASNIIKPGKKKQTVIPEAVPLLAEASIMDIFKPPRIPPARTPITTKHNKKVSTATPLLIVTKTKPGPTRIRSSTAVEKAPSNDNMNKKTTFKDDTGDKAAQFSTSDNESDKPELSSNTYKQILDYLNNRSGRQLNNNEAAVQLSENKEQLIPEQVISADKTDAESLKNNDKEEFKTKTAMEASSQQMVEELNLDSGKTMKLPQNLMQSSKSFDS